MTATIAASRGNANFGTGQLVGRSRPDGRSLDGLRKLFRKIWPAKTPAELAHRTEISIRHAERILAGDRGISGEAIHALLHSDEGWAVLEELMHGCAAQWWRDLQAMRKIENLYRRQEETRRELDELMKQRAAD